METMIRYLKEEEIDLIRNLLMDKIDKDILINIPLRSVNDLIDDGLSINFFSGKSDLDRRAKEVNALYYDNDGIPIFVDIVIDSDGDLYDMDISKADGSSITNYPKGKGEPWLPGDVVTAKAP